MAISLTKDERFALESRNSNLSLEFRLKEEALDPETDLSLSEVLEAVRSAGVQSEIDEGEVSRILEERCGGWVEISKGNPPTEPTHGWLEFFVDPFHLDSHAKEDETGKVNHKELNLFLNVTKGQELVRMHDPVPGVDGQDIFGNPIPCPKPKHALIKTGPGVEVVEDGHLAVATQEGAITRKSDTVAITQIYEVMGDVSYRTGNIEFNGAVAISGNVLGGFKVTAETDVVIGGLVEGAEIRAGGSIRIMGGIQGGDKAILTAGNNIFAKFASDATLIAGDTITIENHILACTTKAGNAVLVKSEEGCITGGETSSRSHIQTAFLGSEIGAKTYAVLGLTPDLVKTIGTKRDELKDLTLRLRDIEQVIQRIASLPEFQSMPQQQVETVRVKSLQQKYLIQGRIKQLEEEIELLDEEIRIAREGSIMVTNKAYGGVAIRICGDTLRLDHDLRHTTFLYEKGEIRTVAN